MKTMADMLKRGCELCKSPLSLDTAVVCSVSYALVGSDKWSEPRSIAMCPECLDKERAAGNVADE